MTYQALSLQMLKWNHLQPHPPPPACLPSTSYSVFLILSYIIDAGVISPSPCQPGHPSVNSSAATQLWRELVVNTSVAFCIGKVWCHRAGIAVPVIGFHAQHRRSLTARNGLSVPLGITWPSTASEENILKTYWNIMNKQPFLNFLERRQNALKILCISFFLFVLQYPQRDGYHTENRCSGKTRQCISHNNEFHKCCLVWLHFFCTLSFNLSLFFLLLPSHSLPILSLARLLTPTFICLYVGKKDKHFFFSRIVLSLTHLSPPCVLCLLSHQWNIDESTEHVSNPHVWCWGVLQGRFLFPLRVGVAVCVCVCICACGLWVICVCVCVYS